VNRHAAGRYQPRDTALSFTRSSHAIPSVHASFLRLVARRLRCGARARLGRRGRRRRWWGRRRNDHAEQRSPEHAQDADAQNWLGYAYRKSGNLDAAFLHYDRALAIDPKHRGAHEYMGEAYLMMGNLAQAEEHLKALDQLCFTPCTEYSRLKLAVATWKASHAETVGSK
jgi:tetratricopeptide (TPR) repeat protein